ncbi:MAG TPA: hypothetical protein VGP25_05955 [Gemmatimonadaceae bacterium]|jgi:hypothetical protein|nr:hypothetical protein [Gemmatimonadaceae bacterium]
MIRTVRIAVLALCLGACAHASKSPNGGGAENEITEQEIDASGAITAYDVVQKVRRNFLTDRGKTTILGSSPSKPTVFLDGVAYGEILSLRNISARQVSNIKLYRAWEAQQRYGNGYVGGVIEVTTRK